ncbi:LOW QUALITY PROTEIN: pre-mRNA-splicing factor CWC22 homolog [Rhagoletis pomonella]|uniref:LOW QUALITY PROTEIN: pre-mRNA-splicing factor CWC22 homolog n=1 Tax=Rhagoletis pomonella TaxID=28610 RepID=UPI00177BAF3A|nr:LOW QUALITY PROTEIN: pre-mRNA-splicing factor CWC22 homolog [Rhagoletis pomonella]
MRRHRHSQNPREGLRSQSPSYQRSRLSSSIARRQVKRKRRHAKLQRRDDEKREKRRCEKENSHSSENSPKRNTWFSTSKGFSSVDSKVAENNNATVSDAEGNITERQRRTVDLLTSRTLKKSIHGYINKVNVDNIAIITRELLKENIVRGRGLLCRSIIQAQAASPTFTHVYAALVSIINSKFPNIGEILLKRLVIQFKRAFRRNDKAVCLSSSRFIAHLVNQRVAHEILALEILTLLVETPTDDSVEVAIAFLKECGMKLTEVSSKGIGAIFEMLKNILHEGKLDKRVQYMIEVVFQVRKDGFKDHQSVIESLELVEEDDQFTHLLMLDEATNPEDALSKF